MTFKSLTNTTVSFTLFYTTLILRYQRSQGKLSNNLKFSILYKIIWIFNYCNFFKVHNEESSLLDDGASKYLTTAVDYVDFFFFAFLFLLVFQVLFAGNIFFRLLFLKYRLLCIYLHLVFSWSCILSLNITSVHTVYFFAITPKGELQLYSSLSYSETIHSCPLGNQHLHQMKINSSFFV